jgi:O-antigen/teichoic acid export membrane protein
LLKAFSWVVTANLARQLAFLAVNAVLFSRLSRPTFGALALAFGYMTVFAGLGEFGIRQIGWRDIARYPEKAADLAGGFLRARTLTAGVSVTLYAALMPVLWEPGAPAAIYLCYALPIAVNQSTFEFPLFGLGRIDLYARYSLVAFSLYVLVCMLFVTTDERAWMVPVFFALAMGLLLLLEARWLRATAGRLQFRLPAAELSRILRASWPIGIAETVNRLALSYPVIIIGALAGAADVGNYRIAEMGYSFLAQLGYMFASAGFSRLAHVFEHDRSRASFMAARMLTFIFTAALVAGAALAALGPSLLALLFDGVPAETFTVVRILGIALVFAAPARFFRGMLASVDQQRTLMIINTIALAIGLTAGWAATNAYGIIGMAGSLIVVEATSLALLLVTFLRSVGPAVPRYEYPVR